MFTIAAEGLLSVAKKKQLTIGFFAALHTYGRALNFNTHIHLSLAEYGINQHNDLKRFSFHVQIAKKTTHKNQTKSYIGRYLKKPPIAASRLKHIYGGDGNV